MPLISMTTARTPITIRNNSQRILQINQRTGSKLDVQFRMRNEGLLTNPCLLTALHRFTPLKTYDLSPILSLDFFCCCLNSALLESYLALVYPFVCFCISPDFFIVTSSILILLTKFIMFQ